MCVVAFASLCLRRCGRRGIAWLQILGVVQVINKLGDGGFDQDDIKVLAGITKQVANALERGVLRIKSGEKQSLLELLSESSLMKSGPGAPPK